MLENNRQQAWFHGLPGYENPGGVPVEVLNFISPKPGSAGMDITFFAGRKLIADLQSLSSHKTKIPQLLFVIRTDAKQEWDDIYQIANSRVTSVGFARGLIGAIVVTLNCDNLTMLKGISMNPGPPAGASTVQAVGLNTGWVFGLPEEGQEGIPVKIVDFTLPDFDGKLVVTCGKPLPELQRLAQTGAPSSNLILVLPERANRRYIEFKLWDARVSAVEGEGEVVFESPFIECLTGESRNN